MHLRPIDKKDYSLLLKLDKKVYPTKFPVTRAILDKWYQRNPEFGLVYEKNKKIAGMCVAIPLSSKGWKNLIDGKLAESSLDSKFIFDNSRDKQIGIHIYHIEKLDSSLVDFHKICLSNLSKIVENLKKSNKSLKVVGFSGLCVTESGINLFSKKFNCFERKYFCKEHILEKNTKKFLFEAKSKKELNQKLKNNYNLLSRCQMLVTYPHEKSIVWKYFK